MKPRDHEAISPEILLEAALLTAEAGLSRGDLKKLFTPPLTSVELDEALYALRERWRDRGLELAEENKIWRFLLPAEIIARIPHLNQQQKNKTSRAALEILTIIALKGPLTRGEIEEIRGVAVAGSTMQILEEQNWIVRKGRKEALGRPTLWATTPQFLEDFRLDSVAELREAGQQKISDEEGKS